MSVQLSVPLELLQANAAVAEAVENLLVALRANGRRARRPASAPPARGAARAGRAPRARRGPRARRARGADTSRRFVAILREKGTLTTAEAQKALGLKDARAIGGIVGSLNRWAGKKPGSPKIAMEDGKAGERVYSLAT